MTAGQILQPLLTPSTPKRATPAHFGDPGAEKTRVRLAELWNDKVT